MSKKLGSFTGAFGDLGVLLPLLLGLSAFNGVNLPISLAGVGIVYLVSALVFRLPVPVQPLKVACTLALAQGLAPSVMTAAAWQMGMILLLFGLTRWADRLSAFFSKPVIRGVQMGVGLVLIRGGFALASKGMGTLDPISPIPWQWPSWNDTCIAFTALVIPQLPVTLSNAVVGSGDVARRYFRWFSRRVTPSALCLSMGAANLLMAGLGGIPLCHGSSGWTAHKRLGARSFVSTALLGVVFMGLAWTLRHDALTILSHVPVSVLVALLLYVGLRHAMLVLDLWPCKKDLALALCAGGVSFATKNPAIGLAFGMLLRWGSMMTAHIAQRVVMPLDGHLHRRRRLYTSHTTEK